MTRISAFLLFAPLAFAQESNLTVSDPSWKGLQIRFVSRVEPAGPNSAGTLPGGIIAELGRAHHLINDPAHKSFFGYDIVLDPAADGNSAQIRIEPLHLVRVDVSGPAGWTQLQLPRYPVIPNVKVGDTVALDLLVNPATGQKIVDYLTLEQRGSPNGREPHDFALSDVQLTLNNPRIFAAGKLIGSMARPGGTSGAVVWFYLGAERERFNLSLFPSGQFQKDGIVSGNTAVFHEGSVEIRVEDASPIAPGSGVYNLYVWHETDLPDLGEPLAIGSEDAGRHLIMGKKKPGKKG